MSRPLRPKLESLQHLCPVMFPFLLQNLTPLAPSFMISIVEVGGGGRGGAPEVCWRPHGRSPHSSSAGSAVCLTQTGHELVTILPTPLGADLADMEQTEYSFSNNQAQENKVRFS